MISFFINKDFAHVQHVISHLPDFVHEQADILEDNRNIVTKVETMHGLFVVKNFKGMYFFNRLAYSLGRKSKAIRSYRNSERLNKLGFKTPTPVAWIDYYTGGLLMKSYYISTFYPYQTLRQYLTNHTEDSTLDKTLLWHQLAAFAFRLHRNGILHDDFSIGNIFVIPTEEGYDFALTDLNRMRFGKVSYKSGLSNLRRLHLSPEDLDLVIKSYAEYWGMSPGNSIEIYYRIKNKASALRSFRRKIRRYTVGYLERLLASF